MLSGFRDDSVFSTGYQLWLDGFRYVDIIKRIPITMQTLCRYVHLYKLISKKNGLWRNTEWRKRNPPPDRSRKIYRKENYGKCEKLFSDGFGLRETARILKMNKNTTMRYYFMLVTEGKSFLCQCGKPVTHRGWCKYRFQRSQKRQEFMNRWHAKNGKQ